MQQRSTPSTSTIAWVVGALALVQASSFADRTVISVLQQPIKEEFALSDFQVGLLGGLAFAAVYAVLGLPIARLAERRSRRIIIACSLFVWSATTVLCGYATSYLMLFLLRFGVGIGEAGSMPASHSMIADYVRPARRGRAMSALATGAPIGAMLGFVVGGVVAQHAGWRSAFVAVGLPGLLLAALVFFTVAEPPRHGAEDIVTPIEKPCTAKVCFRTLLRIGIYRHIVLAQVLMAIPGYGVGAFAAVYLIRAFGFSLAHAGIVLGIGYGFAYTAGLVVGGLWHDRRGFGLMPAVATLAAVPVAVAAYLSPLAAGAVGMMLGASFLQAFAVPASYAVIHNRVQPTMRATAIALMMFLTNLVGAGLGPALVGGLSDHGAAFAFHASPQGFAVSCPGGQAVAGGAPGLEAACGAASAIGLRWAMILVSLFLVWAAVHYLLVAGRIRRAREAETPGSDIVGLAPSATP